MDLRTEKNMVAPAHFECEVIFISVTCWLLFFFLNRPMGNYLAVEEYQNTSTAKSLTWLFFSSDSL